MEQENVLEQDIIENNTSLTNETAENNSAVDTTPASSPSDELANDAIALAYDYYDHYYEKILDNFDTIMLNDTIIIENQEKIIEQNQNFNLLFSSILFLLTLVFVYTFIRNMLKIR